MSDDIVKRLREIALFLLPTSGWTVEERALPLEAADCIERLRADLAAERELVDDLQNTLMNDGAIAYAKISKLREALEWIAAANSQLEEAREQIDVERYERDTLRELLREARLVIAGAASSDGFYARIDAALKEKK